MSGFPSGKGCRSRRGPLRPSCSASHPPLECESPSSGPDCSHNHQELHEVYFPTSRFKAPKHTKMQEENARDDKQYAAALEETKLEFRFAHFLSVAKRTKRRSRKCCNQVLALRTPSAIAICLQLFCDWIGTKRCISQKRLRAQLAMLRVSGSGCWWAARSTASTASGEQAAAGCPTRPKAQKTPCSMGPV